MDETAICPTLGIPEHLWTSGRPEDPDFQLNEVLYRRIKKPLPENFLENDEVGIEVFEIKDDSYNRSKYCVDKSHVLFNTCVDDNGAHFSTWGIISLSVEDFCVSSPFDLNGMEVICELKPIHVPIACNYSHTEGWFFRDGVKLSNKKPRSMKTLFRRELLKRLKIEKSFGDESILV